MKTLGHHIRIESSLFLLIQRQVFSINFWRWNNSGYVIPYRASTLRLSEVTICRLWWIRRGCKSYRTWRAWRNQQSNGGRIGDTSTARKTSGDGGGFLTRKQLSRKSTNCCTEKKTQNNNKISNIFDIGKKNSRRCFAFLADAAAETTNSTSCLTLVPCAFSRLHKHLGSLGCSVW